MFYGVDVGMKHQQAEANSRATFVDKTDANLQCQQKKFWSMPNFVGMVGRSSFRMMTRIADWYVIYLGKF
jgi:hypothetical protein